MLGASPYPNLACLADGEVLGLGQRGGGTDDSQGSS
jgi:hypothetical protein